jgi:hypothetical protein
MKLGLLLTLGLSLGCATAVRDRAVLYTEEGLEAAELVWDAEFQRRLLECERRYAPRTDEAEACFGTTYDADARVSTAVRAAVALLRSYWAARAMGQSPDWRHVALQVHTIVQDLPPEVREIFARVRGLRPGR